MIVVAAQREQTRARYPDEEGYVERDGVRVFYEVYGDAPTTFLLFPTSPISHSRLWKGQIPYLSRHFRVVVFDPRGNGRSDRPDDAEAYSWWEFVEGRPRRARGDRCGDGAPRRALRRRRLGAHARRDRSRGRARRSGDRALRPAADARRIRTTAAIRPPSRSTPTRAGRSATSTTGGATSAGFLEFFFSQQIPEPHSTKQIEDCVRWGLEGGVESLVLADEEAPPPFASAEEARELCRARPLPGARRSTASSTTARRASARSRSRS